jgi:hypothetical protein
MKSFATQIDIIAPIDTIWRILIDLPGWYGWNSTVERTLGAIERGASVKVFVKQSPGRAFPVRVAELDSPHRMVWVGGMPLGLFKGRRVYELTAPATGNVVIFSMREDYTGPLAGLISKSIPDLQAAFDEFALCLKREAERR